jgi:molybdenum cofactor cytidylyltransferase
MSFEGYQKLAGLILAAGGSRRLGRPKQTLQWQGKAMLCSAVEACLPVCQAGLVVVTGARAAEVETCLESYPVTVVRNPDWAKGISGSLRAGLAALRPCTFAGLLLSLGDQPLVTPDDIVRLADAWVASPEQPAAAHYNGMRGVPAIFPASFCGELMALTGDEGARRVLRAATECSEVAMPAAAMDIDTPSDLEALLLGDSQEDKRSNTE